MMDASRRFSNPRIIIRTGFHLRNDGREIVCVDDSNVAGRDQLAAAVFRFSSLVLNRGGPNRARSLAHSGQWPPFRCNQPDTRRFSSRTQPD
jgi:hypothetical protein